MSDPFTLYTARESALHRLHPLTTLSLVAFLFVLSLVLPGVWAPYLLYGGVLLPLALAGGIPGRFLRLSLQAVLPFAISLFLIQGFFWGEGTPILDVGPLSLKIEGLAFAARSTGRILAIVGSFLLLSFTTRPDALMIALSQRGVNDKIAYIMLTTIQIVPRFQAKANAILDAQRSRGLETEGRLGQRLRALLPLVQPLVLGSILDMEERAIALEVRAFGRRGAKTSLTELADTGRQRLARRLLVLAAAAAAAGRLALVFF